MHDLDRAMFESERMDGAAGSAEHREFLEVLGELVAAQGARPPNPPDAAAREIALAAELLEVESEDELEQFLGGVLRRAAGAVGDLAGSGARRVLRGVLKDAAKKALPAVGRAVGGRLTPDLSDFGERAGRTAGSMLGLELEGLSREDREFETARAFVRFADTAARTATAAERSGMTAAEVAETAATTAAQQHLPGLVPTLAKDAAPPSGQGGRWVRQGNQIVIHGA